MRHVLVSLALCAAASSQGFADCPAEEETITAFGRTFPAGGLLGTLTGPGRTVTITSSRNGLPP